MQKKKNSRKIANNQNIAETGRGKNAASRRSARSSQSVSSDRNRSQWSEEEDMRDDSRSTRGRLSIGRGQADDEAERYDSEFANNSMNRDARRWGAERSRRNAEERYETGYRDNREYDPNFRDARGEREWDARNNGQASYDSGRLTTERARNGANRQNQQRDRFGSYGSDSYGERWDGDREFRGDRNRDYAGARESQAFRQDRWNESDHQSRMHDRDRNHSYGRDDRSFHGNYRRGFEGNQ